MTRYERCEWVFKGRAAAGGLGCESDRDEGGWLGVWLRGPWGLESSGGELEGRGCWLLNSKIRHWVASMEG